MMVDFFGTLPGLLSLAGLAVLLILVSVVRRLAARARARRAGAGAGSAGVPPASQGFTAPPGWLIAAIAAWAAAADEAVPSAEAWKPALDAQDPWLAAGWRNVGVTK